MPGLYADVAPLSSAELRLYRGLDFDARTYMAARGLPGVYSATNVALSDHSLSAPASDRGSGDDVSAPVAVDDRGVAISSPAVAGQKRARATAAEPRASASGASVSSLEPPTPVETANSSSHAGGAATGSGSAGHWHGGAATTAGGAPAVTGSDLSTAVLLRRWREPAITVHGVSCSAANDSIIPRQAVGYISVRTVRLRPHCATVLYLPRSAHTLFIPHRCPT